MHRLDEVHRIEGRAEGRAEQNSGDDLQPRLVLPAQLLSRLRITFARSAQQFGER